MKIKVKYSYGMTVGISRTRQKLECQDKIKAIRDNGVAAIALADGTGRKEMSGFCAGIVADAAVGLLKDRFDELFFAGEEWSKQIIFKHIMKELGKTELALMSMASTLLFVAVKDNRYLAGNIGHGIIISRAEHCTVLAKPQDGSYGNETNYITDLDAIDKLEIYKGELQEAFGFMLLSDGAGRSLYEANTGSLSSVCGTLLQWLDDYDEETVGEALTDNIRKYFTENTEDDITIALMVPDESDEDEGVTGEESDQADESETGRGEVYAEDAIFREVYAGDDNEGLAGGGTGEETVWNEENRTAAYFENEQVEGDEVKDTEKRSKVRRIGIIVLVVIVAALGICFAVSKSLFLDNKDSAGINNEKPLINEDGSDNKETLTNKDTQKGEADRTAEEEPVIDNAENPLPGVYPLVTYAVEEPKFYSAGVYEVGTDLPAGEYFFYTGEMIKPGSITINEDSCLSGELYCMNIRVEEGDTLMSACAFTPSENVNPVQSVDGILISGKYKIGKDIAPGKYTAMSIDKTSKGKYYSILDGEISNDTAYRGTESVTVPEEGYIVLYNSAVGSDEEALERAVDVWGSASQ